MKHLTQDAEKALKYGVDGIIVSNHGKNLFRTIVPDLTRFCTGGRQVDGAIPSLYALTSIMTSAKIKEAQLAGKLTILFDSGIRTGSDIIKALALGAQAVLREFLVISLKPIETHIVTQLAGHGCTDWLSGAKPEPSKSSNIRCLIWITLLAWLDTRA